MGTSGDRNTSPAGTGMRLERWQLRRKPSKWGGFAMGLVAISAATLAVLAPLGEGKLDASMLVFAAIPFVLSAKMFIDRLLHGVIERQTGEIADLRRLVGAHSRTAAVSESGDTDVVPTGSRSPNAWLARVSAANRLEHWILRCTPLKWMWLLPAAIAVVFFVAAIVNAETRGLEVSSGLVAVALCAALWSSGLFRTIIDRQAREIKELRRQLQTSGQ